MALKGVVNIIVLQKADELYNMAMGDQRQDFFLPQICARQTGQNESAIVRGQVNIIIPRKK